MPNNFRTLLLHERGLRRPRPREPKKPSWVDSEPTLRRTWSGECCRPQCAFEVSSSTHEPSHPPHRIVFCIFRKQGQRGNDSPPTLTPTLKSAHKCKRRGCPDGTTRNARDCKRGTSRPTRRRDVEYAGDDAIQRGCRDGLTPPVVVSVLFTLLAARVLDLSFIQPFDVERQVGCSHSRANVLLLLL